MDSVYQQQPQNNKLIFQKYHKYNTILIQQS